MSVQAAVKQALRAYKHCIEINDFNSFFKKVQEEYTPRTTNAICNMFFTAHVDFLPHMTFLPEGCFELSTIREFQIPSNIQRICFRCFNGSDLQQVIIPSNVYEIEEEAFEACDFLSTVQIKEGCKHIGMSCFAHCDELITVVLPSSLQSFGVAVFYGCIALETIHYNATVEQWHKIKNSDYINDNTPKLKKIQCVDGTIEF